MEAVSSSLATPTSNSLIYRELLNLSAPISFTSAPTKIVAAPSKKGKDSDIEFEVEEPSFSNPKTMSHRVSAVNCDLDLTKRWYVSYYVPNPITNKEDRKRAYGAINKFHTVSERQAKLLALKTSIIQMLDPDAFAIDGTAFEYSTTITFFINDYIRRKKKVLEPESIKLYYHSLKVFHIYLKENKLTAVAPKEINKQIVIHFIDSISGTISNRSVNNHIDFISGFFNDLIKVREDVLIKNPFDGVDRLNSKSEVHVAYTKYEAEKLSAYMQENDPSLLNFCRFVAFAFLRCKEIRTLKIGDLDMEGRTILLTAMNAKTGVRKRKPMLDTMHQYITEMNILEYPKDWYVFTIDGKPGPKKAFDNFFSRRFKIVKNFFGLTKLHTIYGFRHTFVCELLKSGAPWHEIMKYTGHTTMEAFEKYARSLLNEPAVDLSANIKIKF